MDINDVPVAHKSKPKRGMSPTNSDLHVQQVLKDVEFQKQLIKIRDNYAAVYHVALPGEPDYKAGSLPSVVQTVSDHKTKEHRLFLEWEKFEDEDIRSSIDGLVEDYAIDVFWIIECINSPYTIPYFFNRKMIRSRALVEEDSKSLFIRIWANTQLDDIKAMWDEVEYAKKASYFEVDSSGKWQPYNGTRNKVVDDPELIYAIFRAKREDGKLTSPQIFDMYQKGILPRYKDKPTNQFSSSKSLENYYRKYKPIT